ncbi:MAG: hypothetical protein ABSC23_07430 [Bryobacteraceae bacterium]|jgi:hypothetical protein
MTIERKLFVGIEDIKALVFECKSCLSRMSIPPKAGASKSVPAVCPTCRAEWWTFQAAPRAPVFSVVQTFVDCIERLRALASEGVEPGARILLEFEEPRVP